MATYPTSPRAAFLSWCEAHVDTFQTNAVTIGLTPAQATAFKSAVIAADGAQVAQEEAQQAAKAATTACTNAFDDLRASAAEMVRTIRTFAENTNNPNVYAVAQIPPPQAASTVPPPGTPSDFSVALLQNGAIELKWKCQNPSGASGTIYEVRRGPASGPFAFIGATGTKTFTDATLPRTSTVVTYEITAVRSTQRGNPATWNVMFGVGSGGGAGGAGFAITGVAPTGGADTISLAA